MTIQNQSLVSIGLPVYNEIKWIRRALDSWLAQDYSNLELIVADNASTDGTAEICREYSARDVRIRLIENPHNIGPIRNHKLVFELSRGRYFIWAGGHDHAHPAFISKTVSVLNENDTVAMCTVRSEFRDENDVCWRTTAGGLDLRGLPPQERFKNLLAHVTTGGGTANIFYALYRRDVLSSVMDFKKTIGSDVILLSQIALLGDVIQLDDILYYRFAPVRRDGTERTQRQIKHIVGGEEFQVDSLMPYIGMLFGYMQVIEESKLPAVDRQFMFQVIREEAYRLKVILHNEFAGFVEIGQHELQSNRNFVEIQRYRATQILDGLNKAQMLGIKTWRSNRLRSASNKVLGKIRRIRMDPLQGKRIYILNMLSKFKKYFVQGDVKR